MRVPAWSLFAGISALGIAGGYACQFIPVRFQLFLLGMVVCFVVIGTIALLRSLHAEAEKYRAVDEVIRNAQTQVLTVMNDYAASYAETYEDLIESFARGAGYQIALRVARQLDAFPSDNKERDAVLAILKATVDSEIDDLIGRLRKSKCQKDTSPG